MDPSKAGPAAEILQEIIEEDALSWQRRP